MGNNENNISFATRIFAEYGEFIYKIAFYKVRDKNLADDLFQNFFLSTVINPIPANIKNIKSYIYRAIINDSFDEIRRVKKQQKLMENYARKPNFSINNYGSEDALIKEEWYYKVFEIIGGLLSPNETQAIKLRYKDGFSIDEVAEKMGVKKESVSRYISIGLKKVRQIFDLKRGNYDDWF